MFSKKRFLIIGAHPDDADMMFGGCTIKLVREGHIVKFVSTTNGDAGHFSETRNMLAKRRFNEAQEVVKISGIEQYQILNNRDGELTPSISNRRRITTIIRIFMPDIVISHRIYDYHADHRATAQLVQDSAYMVMVPLFCQSIPIPKKAPIYMYGYDSFRKPCAFSSDVVVSIDDAISEKLQVLNCHESQYYEWLPFIEGKTEVVPRTKQERFKWLVDNYLTHNSNQATSEGKLFNIYTNATDQKSKYAESFELSEYGRQPEEGELYSLFANNYTE